MIMIGGVNFVYADGVKFAHPLSHLGKSKKVSKLQTTGVYRILKPEGPGVWHLRVYQKSKYINS